MTIEWIIGLVLAIISILLGLIKLWPYLIKWRDKFMGLAQINSSLDSLNTRVDDILSELKPNGGSSIKDAVTRIEIRQLFAGERQRALMQADTRGIFEADINGHLIWANKSFMQMLGANSLQEVRGNGWHTFADVPGWDEAVEEERSIRTTIHVEGKEYSLHTYVLRGDEPIGFLGYVV